MGVLAEQVLRGREAFHRQAWADAFSLLSGADDESPLATEDIERLAKAAYLIGRDGDSVSLLTRAHQQSVSKGDIETAARCAFWVGFQLMNKGNVAQAGGWFARARHLLDESAADCVEQGYLLIPVALQHIFGGDPEAAYATFGRIAEIAQRFKDPDLMSLSGLGRGRALLVLGKTADGLTLLDEIMVAVTAGDVSAMVAGILYCAVIEACHDSFDLRRAHEWTNALSHWCSSQPDLVPYRGQCLVHRAEIMQLHGAWSDAMSEAEAAVEAFTRAPDQPAVGMAFYQIGELHRLRGEFDQAEEAYRQANQCGRTPQPGLAQLRLAQGQIGAAEGAIRRLEQEPKDPLERLKFLPAFVDIMLAVQDVPAARAAAGELGQIAVDLEMQLVGALAAYAQGAVLVADGDPRSALAELRLAWQAWQELDTPYEAARVRVLIGRACHDLGDEDTAAMELAEARRAFEQLGAAPDLARLEALFPHEATQVPGRLPEGLTGREVEVLALVATGKTNREIAADLVISEKTVGRHLSNIFVKLGVTSRAAATAYAYQHDLT